MEDKILKFITDVDYVNGKVDSPFFLLDLFYSKDDATVCVSNGLVSKWNNDVVYKNNVINAAIRSYAYIVIECLIRPSKYFTDPAAAIRFACTNSNYVLGYNFSETEIETILCSTVQVDLVSSLLREKEDNPEIFVEEPFNTLLGCCFGDNAENARSIEAYRLNYNLLSFELMDIEAKLRSPLFSIPDKYHPLVGLYSARGGDVANESQYCKYGLVELTESRKLHDSTPRILDFQYKLSVDIVGVNEGLYSFLYNLNTCYPIKLSFRPSQYNCYDYINYNVPILEHVEYGKRFDLADFSHGRRLITSLYDQEFDRLSVRIIDNDSYFEELLHEPDEFGEYYVTQLFHLETFRDGDGVFIKHFDHEFIKYTLDEYCKRLEQPDTKGHKVKTFKIDDAAIPFSVALLAVPLAIKFVSSSNVIDYFFEAPMAEETHGKV